MSKSNPRLGRPQCAPQRALIVIASVSLLLACTRLGPTPPSEQAEGEQAEGSAVPTGADPAPADSEAAAATGTRALGEIGVMGHKAANTKDNRRYAVQGPQDAEQRAPAGRKRRMALESGGGELFALGFGMGGALQPSNTENYSHIAEHGFVSPLRHPLSTFAADVDTASYSSVRSRLRAGVRPVIDSVRVEELINYFDYDYGTPDAAAPFAVHTEISDCPWNEQARLVHIGLKTKAIDLTQAPPKNLVFLVDVSGSMAFANKLPLLKRSLSSLAQTLTGHDRVSLVVYAGASGVVLPPTPGSAQVPIAAALERLEAGGSTNGAAGIELAYQLARSQRIAGGINRVILATDGDFNVGTTSHGALVRLIERERRSGVFLTVLGFGRGNLKDSTMEALADHGNGNYAYIDSLQEARRALVEEAGATLVTVAKDVKFQVEFNPQRVSQYRLIGYENRKLNAEDFNDDTKDAGEVGAGHSVTALYEVLPAGASATAPDVDPLKYQESSQLSTAASNGELLTLKIRYKTPEGSQSQLLSFPVQDAGQPLHQASDKFRFSAAVAQFGMLLRDSKFKGTSSWTSAARLAEGAVGSDRGGKRREFLTLLTAAQSLN